MIIKNYTIVKLQMDRLRGYASISGIDLGGLVCEVCSVRGSGLMEIWGYCFNPECPAYRKIQKYVKCFECGKWVLECDSPW